MPNFPPETGALHSEAGFRSQPQRPSLSEVHRSLVIPPSASFWRKLIAFGGPGFLVAVGYMDPGNWATDLAGGSKYNYALLSVIML
ncbi:MAG: Nramp family divalent metal transporter, partial [Chthoniobacterales bacterium]